MLIVRVWQMEVEAEISLYTRDFSDEQPAEIHQRSLPSVSLLVRSRLGL